VNRVQARISIIQSDPTTSWNICQIGRKIVVVQVGYAASVSKEDVEFSFILCYLIAKMWR
jgi:hypothetical protein